MTNPDELSGIIDRIATGKQTEADNEIENQFGCCIQTFV
jgi:hypothetical protein